MADISVGSVSVDVVPDATGFARELKAKLGGISIGIGIDVDTTGLRAQLDEVTRDRTATINVDADTSAAEAQIDLASRSRSASLDLSSGGVGAATKGFSGISSSLGRAVTLVGALSAGIVIVGTALIPVVASVAGLVGLLGVTLGAAGGGLTVFGLLAGKAIGDTNRIGKQIDDLRKKADTLVDPAAAKVARDQAKALEASLTGPQKAFLKAKDTLSGAFDKLLGGKTGEALFKPIVAGMDLLSKVLPKVSPLISAVSESLTGLLETLSKKASGSGFTKFMQSFANLAGTSLTALGKIAGNLAVALGNVFGAFAPAGKSFLDTLVDMSAKFADFTAKTSTKEGLQRFIEYVKVNGPVVAKLIGNFVVALVRWMQQMAPTGAAMIKFIGTVTAAFAKFYPLLAGGLAGIVGAIRKVGSAFSTIGSIFTSVYNSLIGPALSFLLSALGRVMQGWASMLKALGRVPGFGWAKAAGRAMSKAADDALGLADRVKRIPSKVRISVTSNIPALIAQAVRLNEALKDKKGAKTHYSTGYGGGQTAYASGTNSAAAGVALVGELGPELVRFRGGEQVVTAAKTKSLLTSPSRADGLRGSVTDLSDSTISALIDGLLDVLEVGTSNAIDSQAQYTSLLERTNR